MVKHKFSQDLITYLSGFEGWTAYGAILGVLFICGMGVPIPEDITLLAAGILAAIGNISLYGALIVGFVGVMIGDTILFMLGRKLGRRAFELPIIRKIIKPEQVVMAEQRVLRNSRFICFTARFLPGLRSPVFLTAGIVGVKPLVFFGLDGFAALISVPVWVFAGYWFGVNMDDALHKAKSIQLWLFGSVLVLIVGYVIYKKIKRKQEFKINQSPQL